MSEFFKCVRVFIPRSPRRTPYKYAKALSNIFVITFLSMRLCKYIEPLSNRFVFLSVPFCSYLSVFVVLYLLLPFVYVLSFVGRSSHAPCPAPSLRSRDALTLRVWHTKCTLISCCYLVLSCLVLSCLVYFSSFFFCLVCFCFVLRCVMLLLCCRCVVFVLLLRCFCVVFVLCCLVLFCIFLSHLLYVLCWCLSLSYKSLFFGLAIPFACALSFVFSFIYWLMSSIVCQYKGANIKYIFFLSSICCLM